ncbi:MAG: bacteriohemerythrin [Bacteroidales bacterium]|nr:bacteriohemerythrin [Bacteroidales bacterium]
MINEFYDDVVNKNSNRIATAELIKKLKEYISYHFNTEEKFLTQHNYPEYREHKKEHDIFAAKVQDIEKRFRQDKLILSVEITNFLQNWLIHHIKGTDKAYSDFLIKHGIS